MYGTKRQEGGGKYAKTEIYGANTPFRKKKNLKNEKSKKFKNLKVLEGRFMGKLRNGFYLRSKRLFFFG